MAMKYHKKLVNIAAFAALAAVFFNGNINFNTYNEVDDAFTFAPTGCNGLKLTRERSGETDVMKKMIQKWFLSIKYGSDELAEFDLLAADLAHDVFRNGQGAIKKRLIWIHEFEYDLGAGRWVGGKMDLDTRLETNAVANLSERVSEEQIKDTLFGLFMRMSSTDTDSLRVKIDIHHWKMAIALLIRLCEKNELFCPSASIGVHVTFLHELFVTALSLALQVLDEDNFFSKYEDTSPIVWFAFDGSDEYLDKQLKPTYIKECKELEVEFLDALEGKEKVLTKKFISYREIDWTMAGEHPFGPGKTQSKLLRKEVKEQDFLTTSP